MTLTDLPRAVLIEDAEGDRLRESGLLDRDQALVLTAEIKQGTQVMFEVWANLEPKIRRAFEGQAWRALGYSSWDEYCAREFSQTRMFDSVVERRERGGRLVGGGFSMRAAAAVLGIDESTVRADMKAGSGAGSPAPDRDSTVLGRRAGPGPGRAHGKDGKSYPRRRLARRDGLERDVTILGRLGAGESQQEIAADVGVTQSRVSQIRSSMADLLAPLDEVARGEAESLLAEPGLSVATKVTLLAQIVGLQLAEQDDAGLARAKLRRGIQDGVAALRIVGEALDDLAPGQDLAGVDGLVNECFEIYSRATALWAAVGVPSHPLRGEDLARYRSALLRLHKSGRGTGDA
jgi:transcriptional regulator with XRE-family HTH domain